MQRKKKRNGFTLIEIVIVVTIIGLLSAIVGPSLFQRVGQSRVTAAREQIRVFELALQQYYLDNGTYPTTEQGLAALVNKPTTPPEPSNWLGPYLDKDVPLDPWGNPYNYRAPGEKSRRGYDIYSLGADGQEGGTGENQEIGNW